MAFFTTENGDRPLTVNFFDAKEHNAIYQTLVERIFGNTALRTEADFIKLGRSLIEDEVPSNTIEYVIGFTEVILRDEYHNRKECLKLNNLIKSAIFTTMPVLAKSGSDEDIDNMQRLNDIYWRLLLAEARGKQVDSYFLYLEKNREPKDKFYQPRRTVLRKHGVIQALQAMIDDELDILCISMPPGTAKTTCEKFFNSGVIGWFPKDYNLFYSHSGDITRMYYDGVYQICTDSLTYTWRDIFPELKVTSTNAKMQQFNIGAYKPFPSLQTASVGSENAGKVRASKFLLVDDMIGKLEEALNKNQLDKLWGAYSVDATQRITVDTDGKPCKEIHIATRWSVHDVIGRLERAYEGNPRFKAIAIPATYEDEQGVVHSNFDYDIGGMDVDFFKKQEAIMDDISYRCLYMQAPIEREGLLYHEDEIRRYLSLPLREPDAVLGICDTKNTGDDFMFLPVFYKYGEDYYCVDCVCDQTTNFDVQYMKMVNMIVDNKVQMLEVESNQGGKAIGTTLIEKLRERKWDCNITLKPTETNKEARIIANSYWIKQRVLFRDKTLYAPKSDYGLMMGQLLAWTQVGKNPHDDIPDGLANFALYVARGNGIAKVEAMAVPW